MYRLEPISHPLLERRPTVDIKEERPTGNVIVFVDATTSRDAIRDVQQKAAVAWPGRQVVVSVRAPLSKARRVGLRHAG
jgi:hypothetical protein